MAAVAASSKEQEPCSSSEGLQEPKVLTFKSLVSDIRGMNVFAKKRDPGARSVSSSLVGRVGCNGRAV